VRSGASLHCSFACFECEVSNKFVRRCLIAQQINFGRFTADPELVPKDCKGKFVIDKLEKDCLARLFGKVERVLHPSG